MRNKLKKLQLEGDKIRLEEKRLDQDGKLAAKSLEINSQLLREYPSQHRKTILTYGAIICFIILIILGFILYCISQGKTEFADKFLNWLSHIGGIAGGFLFGKLINKKKRTPEASAVAEDAEIVD